LLLPLLLLLLLLLLLREIADPWSPLGLFLLLNANFFLG
jgi:hypothetical protein